MKQYQCHRVGCCGCPVQIVHNTIESCKATVKYFLIDCPGLASVHRLLFEIASGEDQEKAAFKYAEFFLQALNATALLVEISFVTGASPGP